MKCPTKLTNGRSETYCELFLSWAFSKFFDDFIVLEANGRKFKKFPKKGVNRKIILTMTFYQ